MEEKICKDYNELKEIILEKVQTKKKTFFTSDLHFQDNRLNLYARDLLFKSSEEVDNYIIEKWNKTVGEKDLVILVGDVSMTKEGLENVNKLNGEKWLVKGNYDISEKDGGTAKYEISDEILLKYFTKVVDDLEIEIGGEMVYINHFPTKTRDGVFNIVGHIHGTWKVQRNMVNVSVDAWHFTPVSEDLIKFQIGGIRKYYDQNVFAGELNSNVLNRTGVVKVLRAPEYDLTTFDNDIYIFLAGPIQGSSDWQEEFIEKIQIKLKNKKTKKNIIIASPKRLGEFDENNFDYDEQVDWESFYLEKSSKQGIIVFWLAKEKEKVEGRSYAQTTRFEIGEWWAKGQSIKNFNIVVGIQKGFEGQRYIEKKFKSSYPNKIRTTIDEMINVIINILVLKILE